MTGKIQPILRVLGSAYAVFLGGTLAVSTVFKVVKSVGEEKKKKFAPRCNICKGKGFYPCKLCRSASTIIWSPLHDPIAINPCVCPTCDGNSIQRCLNCLGKGYIG